MRGDADRVADILDAIDRIERYVVAGRAGFDADELVQVWMVRHLQIIGEAASGLSDVARASSPQVPWRQIIGMRHVLVHGYFDVDLDLVWSVVDGELAMLRAAVQEIAARSG